MKDIKVIFRGNKVPSGSSLNVETYIGSKKLENLQKGLGDFQLDTILRGGPGSINKTPSGFSQEMSDIFRKEGYDALRFPPRQMKGELDTVISLDPKNLNIVDEIPFDDLDDFIRQFLSEQ